MDANRLEKGSEVELEAVQDSMLVSAGRGARPARELTISYPLPSEENIVADITGAYLLGYDLIRISSKSTIPGGDREKIRNSMRRLVGMEIIEEDSYHVDMQFLLDAATLDPQRILRRMGSIALGMYQDAVSGLGAEDRSNLQTIPGRDVEVNRQYFLLVRLLRSTLVDRGLAGSFNLEDIDILDYRVAAGLLENAGDSVVELAGLVSSSGLPRADSDRILAAVAGFAAAAEKSIEAFTGHDRPLAIEAISLHRSVEAGLAEVRAGLGGKRDVPLDLLDMVYMFERVMQPWADVADLVKPVYNG